MTKLVSGVNGPETLLSYGRSRTVLSAIVASVIGLAAILLGLGS